MDIEAEEVTFRSDFTVDLIDRMGSDDSVLRAMLVSTLSDEAVDTMSEAGKVGRIRALMRGRHGTPFEHTALTFRSEAPIFVYREWHRHRVGVSINEQSGRYTQFLPVFYVPPRHRPLAQVDGSKKMDYLMQNVSDETYERHVLRKRRQAKMQWEDYLADIADGIALESARTHLGVNIYSSMYWTCNLRSLMAFLSLRTKRDAFWQEEEDLGEPLCYTQAPGNAMFPSKPQWEIEQSADLMEKVFEEAFPITYAAFNELGRTGP